MVEPMMRAERSMSRGPTLGLVRQDGWLLVQGRLWLVELPQQYTPEVFAAEFVRLTRRLEQESRRVVILIDAHRVSSSSPKNREIAASFFRNNQRLLESKVVAWSFVTPSSLLRGAITAIHWMGRFPIPTRTFDTKTEAMAWLEKSLTDDGLKWD